MRESKQDMRLIGIQWFLGLLGLLLLGWWPLSHWFFADGYHRLLGFAPGTYPPGLVRVIGTCGLLPVLLALMAARRPHRNRDAVTVLIVFSLLMALTYLHLIWTGHFPRREYFNLALSLAAGLILAFGYPWRQDGDGEEDPSRD
jgi:hypothetical protein